MRLCGIEEMSKETHPKCLIDPEYMTFTFKRVSLPSKRTKIKGLTTIRILKRQYFPNELLYHVSSLLVSKVGIQSLGT